MRKKTTLLLLMLTFVIYASNINVQISAEENNYQPTSLELTPHDPIHITSDSGFEVFPGSGIVEDPYLIEGYNITTTDRWSIYICVTTKYFIIRNCYVDAKYYGISIIQVADGTATVINNTCNKNNYFGILLEDSSSSTVSNNTCNNNGCGIYIEDSSSSTVTNNTFTNCGLHIYEYSIDAYISDIVENNWVNGKKLGFFTNLDSILISEPIYGQLILIGCTNVTVRDQILNSATTGLFLYYCTSSVIINNNCSNNNHYGIYLSNSGSSTVSNNTSNNNNRGIHLYSSGSSTVSNNTCNYNTNWDGIGLSFSSSSTVTNNMCSYNYNYGIKLWHSYSCIVTYNLLQENEGYGVYLLLGSDNLIHHNNFVDNNLGGISQACDNSTNNFWYDSATLEGNYWSDWSGTGSYPIAGSANSIDLYPLDSPCSYTSVSTSVSTSETTIESTMTENYLHFAFTLLTLVITLLLIKIISRKRINKQGIS